MQDLSFLYFLWQRFHLDQDLAGWRAEVRYLSFGAKGAVFVVPVLPVAAVPPGPGPGRLAHRDAKHVTDSEGIGFRLNPGAWTLQRLQVSCWLLVHQELRQASGACTTPAAAPP